MGVSRQHRLHPMPGDPGQIGVIDARRSKVRDVAMAALVGTDV